MSFRLLRIPIFFVLDRYIFILFVGRNDERMIISSQIITSQRYSISAQYRRYPRTLDLVDFHLNPRIASERERSFQYLIIRHGSRPHSSNPTDPRRRSPSPPSISAENKRKGRLSLWPPPLLLPSLDFGFDSTAISGSVLMLQLGAVQTRGQRTRPRNAPWKHIYRGQ